MVGFLITVAVSCRSKKNTVNQASYPFETNNLIPWSIVAFDSVERNPEQRVKMVKDLGFNQYAFGGRTKHIETLAQEIAIARKENIKISAVWLYLNHQKDTVGKLKPESEKIFQTLKQTGLKTQIWVGFHPEFFNGLSQTEAVKKGREMVGYLCERAQEIDCNIALYNHGGWQGEPENQLEIIKSLPQYNIGIIYNFHHGHTQLERYPQIIDEILPYLWCVNLNGMKEEGPKIMTIGQGANEKEMIQLLLDKGYKGPWGILGHVKGGDAEFILEENLNGLQTLFPNKI